MIEPLFLFEKRGIDPLGFFVDLVDPQRLFKEAEG
jgi:hypothetical protein